MPKGALEKAVELKLHSKLTKLPGPSWKSALGRGFKGRGLGRAIGATTGVLTAPLYLKGLKQLGSSSKDEQMKGVATIGGTTAVYQLQKGVIEGTLENLQAGVSRSSALKKALGLGIGRLAYKVPAALIMAKGLTSGRGKGKKKSTGLLPVVAGGAMSGAINRLGDKAFGEITEKLTNKSYKFAPKAFGRKLVSGGLAGAAGGVLGGLVLSKAISVAKKSLKDNK